MRRLTCLALAAVLIIAGCGGSGDSNNGGTSPKQTATAAGTASGAGQGTVAIGADPAGALKFTKKTLAAKAGTVTFRFSNPSQTPHALEIEGHGIEKETKVITGASARLVTKLKPGKYEFYCPVDGHKAAGMEGTLVVR